MLDTAALCARLADTRERIARAASRVGRDPASVLLVAIAKTFTAEHVRALAAAGQRDFGENKVQEALAKMDQLPGLGLRWHLVGHLQSNKARRAAERFDVIQSIDDARLVARIDEAAAEAGRSVDLLVQVDLAGEPTKHGVPPGELGPVLEAAARCRALRLKGLMLLPPAADTAEAARPYFAALRALRDRLVSDGATGPMPELSMGMSHDFEIAIEEGATMVRVGTALFGTRPPPARR